WQFSHSNNERTTPMKVMKRRIEVSSLLLGACTGAVAVLCVAAATTKTNAGASGDTTSKGKESQMEQVKGICGVVFKIKDPTGMTAWYRTNLGIQSKGGYTDFTWRDKDHPEEMGQTPWRFFPTTPRNFAHALPF